MDLPLNKKKEKVTPMKKLLSVLLAVMLAVGCFSIVADTNKKIEYCQAEQKDHDAQINRFHILIVHFLFADKRG